MVKPEFKPILDILPEAVDEARLDVDAEADHAAGRIVPHERVRKWLAKGERASPSRNMTRVRRLDSNHPARAFSRLMITLSVSIPKPRRVSPSPGSRPGTAW